VIHAFQQTSIWKLSKAISMKILVSLPAAQGPQIENDQYDNVLGAEQFCLVNVKIPMRDFHRFPQ
jgi:hypothetical protein